MMLEFSLGVQGANCDQAPQNRNVSWPEELKHLPKLEYNLTHTLEGNLTIKSEFKMPVSFDFVALYPKLSL